MRPGCINVTNIWIDPVGVESAAGRIASIISERDTERENGGTNKLAYVCTPDAGSAAYVCTPNAEIMMEAQKDAPFMRILNEASLVVPDGAGVVLAARILGYGRIPRTPGYDLALKLLMNPSEYSFSYYFLGGRPGTAEKAAENIVARSPLTRIAGCRDGYFSEGDEPDVIESINNSGADLLFVALGAPKAEKWIYKNRAKLRPAVCMGVGGTLDTLAGVTRLAPPFFRAHGIEWLYRLARQPWRAKRMLRLPQYVLFTIWWKLRGRPAAR